ncbi:MAG: SMP-30/gluconolactonase/LRE family protein [Candidatus Azotimanducaceae bacterium]
MRSPLSVAIPSRDILGESPWWCHKEQVLWRVDILSKYVFKWDYNTGTQNTWRLKDKVGCFVKTHHTDVGLVALSDGVHLLHLKENRTEHLAPLEESQTNNLFNDGKCDRAGNFWFGSKHREDKEPTGSLYRLDNSGKVIKLLDGVMTSNGIGWSPDNTTIYYTDSGKKTIYSFEFDGKKITNQQIFAEDTEGTPDGLTVDSEGGVWSAKWDGSRVVRYTPDKRVDITIDLPVSRPTSLTFGGPKLSKLFITSASHDRAKEPMAGHVFVYDSPIKGIAEVPYFYDGIFRNPEGSLDILS